MKGCTGKWEVVLAKLGGRWPLDQALSGNKHY